MLYLRLATVSKTLVQPLRLHREVSRPSNRALCFLSDAEGIDSASALPKEPLNFMSRGELSILASMRIFITTATGPTIVLEVKPSDTILSVKDKVHEEVHIPPIAQRLVLADERLGNDKRLENVKTLEDYSIQHGTVLELRRRWMHIYVVGGTRKISVLQVTPRHTVGDVKRMLENRTGIPPPHNGLIWNSELLRDHLTLEDYKIETDITFHCFFQLRTYENALA